MKRTDLLRKLRAIAREAGVELVLVREGSNHSVYRIGNGQILSVPRHNEINEHTARGIIDDAQDPAEGGE